MVVTSALNGLLLLVHLLERVGFADLLSVRGGERSPVSARIGFHPAGWLLVPFAIYAAINAAWITPVGWLGWRDWLGWAQMIAIFWIVLNGVRSRAGRATLFVALVTLGVIAVLLASYQRFMRPDWLMLGRTQVRTFLGRSSGPFGIPNSLAAFLLLILPPTAALALQRRAGAIQRLLFGYLALVFGFGLVLTVSRGALLSLALVLAAWPILALRGPIVRRMSSALGIIATLFALGWGLFFSAPLVRERMVQLKTNSGELTRPIMWRGAWRIFRAHPAWGGGAGSYNVRFEKYRPENFQDEPVWAHNDYLNTLSDYGIAGFTLFFGACGVIGWRCCRAAKSAQVAERLEDVVESGKSSSPEKIIMQALMAGLAAFALQLLVDFNFKIPALAMAFAIVAALVVQSRWRPQGRACAKVSRTRWTLMAVAALAVVIGTVWFAQPLYRGEALRYIARQSIDRLAINGTDFSRKDARVGLANARAALERATAIAPANGSAWSDLAYAIALSAHVDPTRASELGRDAERAARRALACSAIVPEFWVRLGVGLDLQQRRTEAGGAFVEALQLAPARASVWYNYAFHAGLDPSDPRRALAAVVFCLRLDPGNREAQLLRQRLADRSLAP